jgi:hypothetical protein
MKRRFSSLIKRVVSGLSAAVMMLGSLAPAIAYAQDTKEYAHKINLFDIQLTGGADYSSEFKRSEEHTS